MNQVVKGNSKENTFYRGIAQRKYLSLKLGCPNRVYIKEDLPIDMRINMGINEEGRLQSLNGKVSLRILREEKLDGLRKWKEYLILGVKNTLQVPQWEMSEAYFVSPPRILGNAVYSHFDFWKEEYQCQWLARMAHIRARSILEALKTGDIRKYPFPIDPAQQEYPLERIAEREDVLTILRKAASIMPFVENFRPSPIRPGLFWMDVKYKSL